MRRASRIVLGLMVVAVIGAVALHGQAESTKAENNVEQVILAKLEELARISSILVDGELCLNIITDRAEKMMYIEHPTDQAAGSDNYDVNHQPFRQIKQLLLRIAMTADIPVDCSLVMVSKGKPDRVVFVTRQYFGWSQCNLSKLGFEPTPEMKQVLKTGERVVWRATRSDRLSVLAPVRDSLGDVVGFVDVCTRLQQQDTKRP